MISQKDFVSILTEEFNRFTKIISILIYKDLSEEYHPQWLNTNLILIGKDFSLFEDKKFLRFLLALQNKKVISPLVFIESELEYLSIYTPLQALDIKLNHKIVYGKNIFKMLSPSLPMLWRQCDVYLKGEYLTLRWNYLKVRSHQELKEILKESYLWIRLVLQALAWVAEGEGEHLHSFDILGTVQKKWKVNLSAMASVAEGRDLSRFKKRVEMEEFFFSFLDEIAELMGIVDGRIGERC